MCEYAVYTQGTLISGKRYACIILILFLNKKCFQIGKKKDFVYKCFFNSLSSETRRENPGVVGAVPDLYFVESTERWQPETGGSVTVSKMCTILDDTHLSFLAGRYFLIFDSKENHLSYLKFSRANWPEAY